MYYDLNSKSLRNMIYTEDRRQALRIRRFLMGLYSYALCSLMALACYFTDTLNISTIGILSLAVLAGLTNIIFYTIFRTGANRKFSDPSLTLPQIVLAIIWLMALTYYADKARGFLLAIYLVPFTFGIFRLKVRHFILLTAFTIAAHTVVLALMMNFRPQTLNLKVELLNSIILMGVLCWFAIICSYISRLKHQIEKTHKNLEESEARYRELHENMIDLVLLIDPSGRIHMANPRFHAAFAPPGVDLSMLNIQRFIHPHDVIAVKTGMLDNLARKDIRDFQFRLIDADRREIHVECNARCIRKEDEMIGCQLVMRDITRRKNLEEDLNRSYQRLRNAKTATIMGLAKLAEYRDTATGHHLERIREYSRILAVALASKSKYKHYITQEYIEDIYMSSILHDIGKVGIPDVILLKPGKLTPVEFDVVKQHSQIGGDALKAAEAQVEGLSFLTLGKEISYHHHEKWDGSGYPGGLKGEDIPLSARLIALADVYDALTSKRVYKSAMSHAEARQILIDERGRHFDPDVVDAFLENESAFADLREEFRSKND